MADPGFEAFLWSLTQQESGGNYRAVGVWVNGDRAYGRYQVMGANVPSWTARYYGKRLTPQQFLTNNAAQDAVVRGVLGGYYEKYGARGAAAMWYSGQSNPNKTYGNPPVYKYVNSVMARAGNYSGQSIGSAGSGGGGTPTVTPKLDRNELAEQYGLSSALINSSSELRRLFEKAVAGSWSPARFQASLKNSKWWKTQSSNLRKYITTKLTDPATHAQNLNAALHKVNSLAVTVGLPNQIASGGKTTKILRQAAYYAMAEGWTDARLKAWFGAKVGLQGDIMLGEAGDAFDKLHEIAYLNGGRYSTEWYRKAATSIVAGKATLASFEDQIRAGAAARYSAFSEQIKAGMNALDLAAPYLKSVASILELAESDVDLFNPHIAKAMRVKQPGAESAAMPLWQFENEVRNDPLWRKTNNARESMMTIAHQVAKDFGMAY